MRRLLVLTIAILATAAPSATVPSTDQAIVHVLNRIGFGARPGDVDKVRAMGLERYIEQQLHPERIPDAAMTAHLSRLTTIGMSSREIAEKFAIPQLKARREQMKDARKTAVRCRWAEERRETAIHATRKKNRGTA